MALFKRRIKSALYIDYENVAVHPDRIENVVAWLEDGQFDDARVQRRFEVRRVYWNSQANRHRAAYEAKGFEVVLIEKYAGLKNGADIRIAMDMVETALKLRGIDEFILFSRDSDFVPVIQRLGEKDKRTIMMVEEQQPATYTAYDLHADGVIPYRAIMGEASAYVRPKRRLLERIGLGARSATMAPAHTLLAKGLATRGAAGSGAAAAPSGSNGSAPAATRARDGGGSQATVAGAEQIEAAVAAFIKVAARNPGKLTGKQTILKQLKTIRGFTNTGAKPYLGFKSYEELAKEVARRDRRITIPADRLGGITVVYVPADIITDDPAFDSSSSSLAAPASSSIREPSA